MICVTHAYDDPQADRPAFRLTMLWPDLCVLGQGGNKPALVSVQL